MAKKDTTLDKFIESLTPEQEKVVTQLVGTIAMQGESIGKLARKLQLLKDIAQIREEIIAGVSVMSLAAKLNNPTVQPPTQGELLDAIKEMQTDIQSATDAQAAVKTVLKFAMMVAPLAL